jgi:RNA-directed DNA polymerase
VSESRLQGKPFEIPKQMVWEAYQRVKANKGAAGVDGQSVDQFGQDLSNNLYRLWNRMSSGSYFPPPVKAVEIPKASGGVRILGIPTVADRIAQTVVAMFLERLVEPVFHRDSYGYRPGRSALDAVARCRERCWRDDWVIDLDVRAFFDSVDHSLMLKAVARHTDAICRPVAESADAAAGWHAGGPGPGNSAGFSSFPSPGKPVSALRVRYVAGPGIPGCHVRAVL